jgi:hypothetical protein
VTPATPENLRVAAYANPATLTVDIWIHGGGGVAMPVTFQAIESGQAMAPALRLSDQEAQGLMDSLWNAGFRPAGAAGSAGQATAMQAHIEDLRWALRCTLPRTLEGAGARPPLATPP